ncbi:nuclear transport factor 2 family protein [Novosphingobium aquimarinum]|uniref:nuclear transport factor 2 family protein n=1 Tax=Novosphingobium aquimarinum TaxID=2682494 RepID=UPI0018DE622D|nr:nuclear transport factor 2 family protein [Novosphingobium aquimarinum]
MGAEENKALVRRYFQAVSDNRPEEAWTMLADDAVWTVGGHSPLTGTYSKEALARLTEDTILARLVDGMRIDLKQLIAEGDKVCAEFESTGKRADGAIYNNHYLFVLTIRDGKLWRCTEYLDTYHYNELILS